MFRFLLVFIATIITISTANSDSKQDRLACGQLKQEYTRLCSKNTQPHQQDNDFCKAFENICSQLEEDEPESANKKQDDSRTTTILDFEKFCKQHKNQYLYVCPDPFRFGQKAIVFCPLYSERCKVPLPEKPVVPQRKSSKRNGSGAINQICQSYRGFAMNYCSNPFLTSQAQYRSACDKYWRHCGHFHRGK